MLFVKVLYPDRGQETDTDTQRILPCWFKRRYDLFVYLLWLELEPQIIGIKLAPLLQVVNVEGNTHNWLAEFTHLLTMSLY